MYQIIKTLFDVEENLHSKVMVACMTYHNVNVIVDDLNVYVVHGLEILHHFLKDKDTRKINNRIYNDEEENIHFFNNKVSTFKARL